MKIDLGPIQPDALPRIKGGFYLRATRYGLRAQKWPRPGSASKLLAQQQHRTRFGFAARMASNPEPISYQTAVHLSQGTEQVPRDLLTSAAMGRLYEIYFPSGEQWRHLPGSLANRRPEIKTMSWQWSLWDAAWSPTMNTNASATKGITVTPTWSDHFYGIRAILTTVSSATYKATHGTIDASGVITAISSSPTQVATSAALQCLDFALGGDLVANQRNFFGITRTDGANNYALPVHSGTTSKWLWIVGVNQFFVLAQNNPAIGHTLTLSGAGACCPIGILFNQ